ncbi:MAG: hypothetical protein GC160_05830 [Acidobacteria bacterium]|nr:hypothetical protein [Acidobacteriota bacterium]
MTDQEIEQTLRRRGCPEHICVAGRDGLIEMYEDFVREVEEGYELGFEDYSNELDLRTIIGDLGLDEESAVQEADERLQALLIPTEEALWPDAPRRAFWTHGYPMNAGTELEQDLRRLGVISDDEESEESWSADDEDDDYVDDDEDESDDDYGNDDDDE